MRKWDGQDGERKERKSREKDNLIERDIVGRAINLSLGNLPGIHKNDSSEYLKQ